MTLDFAVAVEFASGGLALALGAIVVLRAEARAREQSIVFALFAAAVAVWCFATAAEATVAGSGAKLGWLRAAYAGIALAPPLWLWLALHATGHAPRQRRWMVLLFTVPTLTVLFALLGPGVPLMLTSATLVAPDLPLDPSRGLWFWAVHLPWSYAAIALAAGVLARAYRRSRGLYRRRYGLMLAAGLLPVAVNGIYLLGFSPLGPLDPTPVGLGVSGGLVALALSRYGIFDISPVIHETVFHALPDSVFVVDPQGVLIDLNPAATEALGGDRDTLLGTPIETLIPRWSDLHHRRRSRAEGPEAVHEVNLTWDGRQRDLEVRLAPLRSDSGRLLGHAVISHDTSLRKALEAMAMRDPLTGLGNRRLYELRAEEMLQSSFPEGLGVGVLYLDLDHFKPINDRFGHALGDAVLVEIAERFRSEMRPGDLLVRLGGDEFAVLLPAVDRDDVLRVAERLVRTTAEPLASLEHESVRQRRRDDEAPVGVGVSVGIALHPQHGRDADTLLQRADAAMYRAKRGKRSGARHPPRIASGFDTEPDTEPDTESESV